MDDLIRQLRDSDPDAPRRSSALSARAEQELAELLATEPAPASARRPWVFPTIGFGAAAAAAVALAVVIAVTGVGAPAEKSVAVTAPPLLETTALVDSSGSVLGHLSTLARKQGGTSKPGQTVHCQSWAAQLEVGEKQTTSYVQPEELEWHWEADYSGYLVARAGEVLYGDPTVKNPAAKPGSLLHRDEFGAGEFPMPFARIPPDEVAELREYLAGYWGLTPDSSSSDWLAAIDGLRMQWRLTGPQTSAVLDLIESLPDVTLAGAVTDRLGRAGVAVQADNPDGTLRQLLIFSSDSGLLLSSETVYLGGLDGVSLDYPTVFTYNAWKD